MSGYSDQALDEWAERVRRWQGRASLPRDVYVYFDNDAKVKAPFDAINLGRRLGLYGQGEIGYLAAPQDAGEEARARWPDARRRSQDSLIEDAGNPKHEIRNKSK